MLLPSAASPVLDDVAKNVHGEPLRARRAGACRGRAQKPHRPVRASAERRRRLARCGGPLGRPVSAQCRPEKNEEQNPDGRDVEPGGVDVTDGETPLDDRRRRLRSRHCFGSRRGGGRRRGGENRLHGETEGQDWDREASHSLSYSRQKRCYTSEQEACRADPLASRGITAVAILLRANVSRCCRRPFAALTISERSGAHLDTRFRGYDGFESARFPTTKISCAKTGAAAA